MSVFLFSLRYSINHIVNVCFNNSNDNAHSIIGEKKIILEISLISIFMKLDTRQHEEKHALSKIHIQFQFTFLI